MSHSAIAEPSHEGRDHRDGVEHRQPDHPVERERVKAHDQAGRTQFEDDAFRRFNRDNRVQCVGHAERLLRLDDDGVRQAIVQALALSPKMNSTSMKP